MLLFTGALFLILLKLRQQRKALFPAGRWGAIVINFLAKFFPSNASLDVTCP